jgi:hypothetical protein
MPNENNNAELIVSFLITLLGSDETSPEKEKIQTEAEKLRQLYPVSDEELTEIVKKVEAKLPHTMDEGVSLVDPEATHDENWYENGNSIEWNYWEDYSQYLKGENWTPKIITSMEKVTGKILGLLNNPQDPGEWDRRGLVIGDVQSGKTANYLGLVARAADAGYKFIIVIAGIHNNLRKQTQERVDEGFVGRNNKGKLGVGLINKGRLFPVSLTTPTSDFNINQARKLIAGLDDFGKPVIVVIKKHVKTLSALYEWLKNYNTPQGSEQIPNIPMLMIDDEADHASINTSKEHNDPTRTNQELRRILKLFRQKSYIGYTATPFANIFINPDSEEEMLGDDLFPRDFIYCLDSPTDYFGPRKVFLDDASSSKIVREIYDIEEHIPEKHKITFKIEQVPPSLKRAIKIFFLGRAVRIARETKPGHSSMMINVSRFKDVQRDLRILVDVYIEKLSRAIEFNYALPVEQALRNSEEMAELKNIFIEEFSDDLDETWERVQSFLYESVKPVKVQVINSSSEETLEYEKAKDEGGALTVVAVGGLSLSRGLTLEGLSVSYVYRNSKMYDTVMQMARWFGYRPGYEEMCRVYLSENSCDWYCHIAEAIDELRQQVQQMRRNRQSPREFGLYVRSHPDALAVTAANKMRDAEKVTFKVNFDGKLRETHILSEKKEVIDGNTRRVRELYNKLKGVKGEGENYDASVLWEDVDWKEVSEFIDNFEFHAVLDWEKKSISSYTKNIARKFPRWDVAFISVKSSSFKDPVLTIGSQKRTVRLEKDSKGNSTDRPVKPPNKDGWYIGGSRRVGATQSEKIGLNKDQIKEAEKQAQLRGGKLSDIDYRNERVRGKPLLMIHLLDLFNNLAKTTEYKIISNVPAIGVSFPNTGNTGSVECVVNRTWIQMDMFEEEDDYDL